MNFGLTDKKLRSETFTDISGRQADGSATYRRPGEGPRTFAPPIRSVRISILDLIIAALALHEFRLVAAGHAWATLELTEAQLQKLTAARVHWQPD